MAFGVDVSIKTEGVYDQDYSVKFTGKIGERNHFCTAYELYDTELNFWVNGKFGLEECEPHEVPDEVTETLIARIRNGIFVEMQADERRYLFTVMHVGEDSGWGYHRNANKNNWFLDTMPYSKELIVDDEDDMCLVEHVWHIDNLKVDDRDVITRTFIKPVEQTEQKPDTSGGITEEMLGQYLQGTV